MRIITTLFKRKGTKVNFEGEDYGYKWVERLYKNIKKNSPSSQLVVVTDTKDFPKENFCEGVEVHNFIYPERGFVSLLEMLNPEVIKDEKALMIGLDTMLVGPIDKLEEYSKELPYVTTPTPQPYGGVKANNGVVCINKELSTKLWELWTNKRELHLKDKQYSLWSTWSKVSFGNANHFSEMVWLNINITKLGYKIKTWDQFDKNLVISYKFNGQPKKTTAIVFFHGVPKQPNLKKFKWVTNNWYFDEVCKKSSCK